MTKRTLTLLVSLVFATLLALWGGIARAGDFVVLPEGTPLPRNTFVFVVIRDGVAAFGHQQPGVLLDPTRRVNTPLPGHAVLHNRLIGNEGLPDPVRAYIEQMFAVGRGQGKGFGGGFYIDSKGRTIVHRFFSMKAAADIESSLLDQYNLHRSQTGSPATLNPLRPGATAFNPEFNMDRWGALLTKEDAVELLYRIRVRAGGGPLVIEDTPVTESEYFKLNRAKVEAEFPDPAEALRHLEMRLNVDVEWFEEAVAEANARRIPFLTRMQTWGNSRVPYTPSFRVSSFLMIPFAFALHARREGIVPTTIGFTVGAALWEGGTRGAIWGASRLAGLYSVGAAEAVGAFGARAIPVIGWVILAADIIKESLFWLYGIGQAELKAVGGEGWGGWSAVFKAMTGNLNVPAYIAGPTPAADQLAYFD